MVAASLRTPRPRALPPTRRSVALAATMALAAAVGLSSPQASAQAHTPSAPVPVAQLTALTGAAAATTRLSGPDRYATSVAISRANFDPTREWVVVASGETFADALGAGPFASLLRAPLVLVPRTGTLPAATATELDRLKTRKIVVIGGTAAVSASMATQLERHITGGAGSYLTRVPGVNRFDTASQLTEGFNPVLTGVPVYLANSTSADALGGASAASISGGALLLIQPTSLPADTAAALKRVRPSKVYVLGGPSVVSAAVLGAVKAVVPGVTVERVGGADRFATAALASRTAATSAPEVMLANGLNFPDALSGSATALYGGRPVLLTRQGCVPTSTLAEIRRLGATKVTALGGTSMVSDAALKLKAC